MTERIQETSGLAVWDVDRSEEAGDGIMVLRGLNEALRHQLVTQSAQETIMRFTPRDAAERFTGTDAVQAREQDSLFYPLVERQGSELSLAGLVWFSPRPRADANYTFAIRLYEGYYRRGFAEGLSNAAIDDFSRLYPNERSLWLATDTSNLAARHLYEKTGWQSIIRGDTREIMTKLIEAKNPKIVVIGGGTGSYTVLTGLKQYTRNITAVVNMSDDGGSSGELRDELGVLPPGDVRQCLVALSDNDALRRVFEYRLRGVRGRLENHPLGNILLSGIEQMTGDFEEAAQLLGQVLNITGRVVPVTTADATLCARRADGSVFRGEQLIGHMNFGTERPDIWLEPEAGITESARSSIQDADIVVIAPGNLYGSLAPALVVKGMKDALEATKAKRVYVSNLVTKPDQTEGFKVHDFADEIERFVGSRILDYVLFNTDEPTPSMLRKYTHDGELVLDFDLDHMRGKHYQAVGLPLIAKDPVVHAANDRLRSRRTLIRHDAGALAKEIVKLLSR
jgi:uncharacterized cofD-like protein